MHSPSTQQLHSPSGHIQSSQQLILTSRVQPSSCIVQNPLHPTVAKTMQIANKQAKIFFICKLLLNIGDTLIYGYHEKANKQEA